MSHSMTAEYPVTCTSLRPVNDKPRSNAYGRILELSTIWGERIRQRNDLKQLADSPELLMDIGISRYDALREGRKPFWRE